MITQASHDNVTRIFQDLRSISIIVFGHGKGLPASGRELQGIRVPFHEYNNAKLQTFDIELDDAGQDFFVDDAYHAKKCKLDEFSHVIPKLKKLVLLSCELGIGNSLWTAVMNLGHTNAITDMFAPFSGVVRDRPEIWSWPKKIGLEAIRLFCDKGLSVDTPRTHVTAELGTELLFKDIIDSIVDEYNEESRR